MSDDAEKDMAPFVEQVQELYLFLDQALKLLIETFGDENNVLMAKNAYIPVKFNKLHEGRKRIEKIKSKARSISCPPEKIKEIADSYGLTEDELKQRILYQRNILVSGAVNKILIEKLNAHIDTCEDFFNSTTIVEILDE